MWAMLEHKGAKPSESLRFFNAGAVEQQVKLRPLPDI